MLKKLFLSIAIAVGHVSPALALEAAGDIEIHLETIPTPPAPPQVPTAPPAPAPNAEGQGGAIAVPANRIFPIPTPTSSATPTPTPPSLAKNVAVPVYKNSRVIYHRPAPRTIAAPTPHPVPKTETPRVAPMSPKKTARGHRNAVPARQMEEASTLPPLDFVHEEMRATAPIQSTARRTPYVTGMLPVLIGSRLSAKNPEHLPLALHAESVITTSPSNTSWGVISRLGTPIGTNANVHGIVAYGAGVNDWDHNNPVPGIGTVGLGGGLGFFQGIDDAGGTISGSLDMVFNTRPGTAEYLKDTPITSLFQLDIRTAHPLRAETSLDGSASPGGWSQAMLLERVELAQLDGWGVGLAAGVLGYVNPTHRDMALRGAGGVLVRYQTYGDIVVGIQTSGDIVFIPRISYAL